ncbi:MAG: hypothetical protein A3E57_08725 [Candidatus Muproteobacteria bacterium RIFCSPHIGHO2_12_FULL_60_33]|nr:MAG: hypothetical protein A3E57_08725 [Candidatus Muproteobacteria bacterium RIFCSPHIGHO2_12_FULL_60_33]
MKYFLGFIGMLVGQIAGGLIADSQLIDWTLGVILAVVGYHVPAFIKYTRSTPKQLLAFHGPGAPISRSTSSGELKTFLSQLHDGGLLLDFHPKNDSATVDGTQWANLVDSERLTLAQVLMQAQAIDGATVGEVRILDGNGELLTRYSASDKTVGSPEKLR